MPGPYPPEFRQQAVELNQLREKPIAQIAADRGQAPLNSNGISVAPASSGGPPR